MKLDVTRFAKLALIFLGLLFLVCLWFGRRQSKQVPPPEGEKITVADVEILLDALGASVSLFEADGTGRPRSDQEAEKREGYLTYGQYEEICRQIGEEEWQLPHYEGRYEPEQALLKQDWYEAFRILLAHLDIDSSIWETTVFLLKVDESRKEAYTENGAMQGAFSYCSGAFADNVFQEMKVYVKNDVLLTIVEVLPEEHYLGSVWVMEVTENRLDCFYRQVAFCAEASEKALSEMPEREQIAHLTFRDGKLVQAEEQREKVHGRLLRISEKELEIEGQGVYEIEKDAAFYKLYGKLASLTRSDLRVGCADTDFIIEKGKVCAGLVSEREEADRIRVLLKNTAAGSNFHKMVALTVDGEKTLLQKGDMEVGERRTYRSENLTDKVLVELENSTREDLAYRGSIECLRMEEGIVVVNELPLEEYLYGVVPSEMPASYPEEALKAQAVCARTYAYLYILRAGLPALGAHVDDTTAYQVYHNIAENANTTTAVKETDGVLLTYQGEAAGNYYYSTSCGAGTDVASWQGGSGENVAYMCGGRVGDLETYHKMAGDDTEEITPDAESLRDEEVFRQFITTVHEEDLEKDEPWYRWTYRVEEMDTEAFFVRLKARYDAAPASVLTKAAGDYYVSEPIGKPGKIKRIEIEKRGAGGIAQELTIEAEKATYRVISEYNIRYVLCDGKSQVIRQDGSASPSKTLLPSGFFVLDTVSETGKAGENVVGYTLTGGGFGHGVGMSQNGAKALGEQGADYGQILSKFFPGCTVRSAADLNIE